MRGKIVTIVAVLAIVALVVQTGMILLMLFGPVLPYSVPNADGLEADSEQFLRTITALTNGQLQRRNTVEVLRNGENFYPSMLNAMRKAQTYIFLECYIFQKGRVTDDFLAVMTERARAGVTVYLVIDAIGSAAYPKSKLDALKNAGGQVGWYHPVRWYSWPRINNRTHREILVVDGKVGFTGGAGFADQWLFASPDEPQWRDTMVRFEGDAATALAATFAENWLESAGAILLRPSFFPFPEGPGTVPAVTVSSSPTSGRSTQARILFQSLLATAKRKIDITTPYFLPDDSLISELKNASKKRGVPVRVLVPGKKSDHLLTRASSRRLYGDLLQAGIRIYEYQPSMIHAKLLLIDDRWAVVGTTNMDPRSFGINDEVSVAVYDRQVAERLEADFENDLGSSRAVTYEEWLRRPRFERLLEPFGALIERLQ